MHASIGPSCAVADWSHTGGDKLTVWAGTQNPHVLRADLAHLTGLADLDIEIIRMEASGCYGRNGADDVAADAALLSRAVGAPVRVQLTREQENLWEPKGAAQWMQVRGGLNAEGELVQGDSVEEIANCARRIGADLIVVGHKHLESWTERWWRGSVSKALIEQAPCSVLVAITR
jgi:CO/xanthine dehydrogenase Mo-binding subunit